MAMVTFMIMMSSYLMRHLLLYKAGQYQIHHQPLDQLAFPCVVYPLDASMPLSDLLSFCFPQLYLDAVSLPFA